MKGFLFLGLMGGSSFDLPRDSYSHGSSEGKVAPTIRNPEL